MSWNASQIDTLTRMAPASSAAQIARAIGVTRNAVIGKSRRLGVKLGGVEALAKVRESRREAEMRLEVVRQLERKIAREYERALGAWEASRQRLDALNCLLRAAKHIQ